MNRNKLSLAFKRVCKNLKITFTRIELGYHLNRLESENIPNGISDQNLDEIIFDYLYQKSVIKGK